MHQSNRKRVRAFIILMRQAHGSHAEINLSLSKLWFISAPTNTDESPVQRTAVPRMVGHPFSSSLKGGQLRNCRARSSAPPPQARGHGRSQADQQAMLRHRLCFEKAARHDGPAAFSFRDGKIPDAGGRTLFLIPRWQNGFLPDQMDRHPAIAPDSARMFEVLTVIGGEHPPALFCEDA